MSYDIEQDPEVLAMRAQSEEDDGIVWTIGCVSVARGRPVEPPPYYARGCRESHKRLWTAIEAGDMLTAKVALAVAPLRYRAAFALVGFVTGLTA